MDLEERALLFCKPDRHGVRDCRVMRFNILNEELSGSIFKFDRSKVLINKILRSSPGSLPHEDEIQHAYQVEIKIVTLSGEEWPECSSCKERTYRIEGQQIFDIDTYCLGNIFKSQYIKYKGEPNIYFFTLCSSTHHEKKKRGGFIVRFTISNNKYIFKGDVSIFFALDYSHYEFIPVCPPFVPINVPMTVKIRGNFPYGSTVYFGSERGKIIKYYEKYTLVEPPSSYDRPATVTITIQTRVGTIAIGNFDFLSREDFVSKIENYVQKRTRENDEYDIRVGNKNPKVADILTPLEVEPPKTFLIEEKQPSANPKLQYSFILPKTLPEQTDEQTAVQSTQLWFQPFVLSIPSSEQSEPIYHHLSDVPYIRDIKVEWMIKKPNVYHIQQPTYDANILQFIPSNMNYGSSNMNPFPVVWVDRGIVTLSFRNSESPFSITRNSRHCTRGTPVYFSNSRILKIHGGHIQNHRKSHTMQLIWKESMSSQERYIIWSGNFFLTTTSNKRFKEPTFESFSPVGFTHCENEMEMIGKFDFPNLGDVYVYFGGKIAKTTSQTKTQITVTTPIYETPQVVDVFVEFDTTCKTRIGQYSFVTRMMLY